MLDFKEKSEIYLIHLSDIPYLVQKSSIYRKINHITDFLNCTSLLSAIKSIRTALLNAYSLRLLSLMQEVLLKDTETWVPLPCSILSRFWINWSQVCAGHWNY